jgi:hypothetical protein
MNKQKVLDYLWSENDFLHNVLAEGVEELAAYAKETFNIKKVDSEIKEHQRLKQYNMEAPRLPNGNKTNGGPMYMSVGEEIAINKTVYREFVDENGVS